MPNTSYSVYLWFAEIAGAQVNYRRFYIKVNGVNYGEFDIALLASGQNKLYITGPSLTVTNGQIDIQLVPITGDPMIAAIEIVQTAGTVEDTCQRTNFYYDVNPFDGTFPQYASNRPAVKLWGGVGCQSPYQFFEMYSYTQGGLITKKRLRADGSGTSFQLDTSQTYDNEGKVLTVKYPDTLDGTGRTYTYTYDGLGRPIKLVDDSSPSKTWVDNVQFGPSDELKQIFYGGNQSYLETRAYNVRAQLTRMTVTGAMDIEYQYSATQNNGQISQQKDWLSGEEVTYTYDSLSRLVTALTTGPEWGQSYTYDGFGNRTNTTGIKGTAPPSQSLIIDPATNRVVGLGYDANGNMTYGQSTTLVYDIENRVTSAVASGSGPEYYAYTPDNKRIWKKKPNGDQEFYFYGIGGQRLGTYGRGTVSGAGTCLLRVEADSDEREHHPSGSIAFGWEVLSVWRRAAGNGAG